MSAKIKSFSDLSDGEVRSLVLALGEPSYRARQLRRWLYCGLADSFQEMTDLPLAFRQALAAIAPLKSLELVQTETARDGTIKALFALADGLTVESVLMGYPRQGGGERYTVCISNQAGCGIGCPFCATGRQGFQRNLTAGEIVDQVLHFARFLRDGSDESRPTRLTNVVFMGMGEPLANYDPLRRAIRALNSPEGFGLGARNMTVSTAGMVPQIKRLAEEGTQVGLAVSLHAPDNALRDRLVPLNRKYPLEELIPVCREYYHLTGRRVSFEYTLFEGVNDAPAQARALARLLQGFNCHVNLIAANQSAGPAFRPPAPRVIHAFERELKQLHIKVTLRQPRGQDIAAGCGQLRGRNAEGFAGRQNAPVR